MIEKAIVILCLDDSGSMFYDVEHWRKTNEEIKR